MHEGKWEEIGVHFLLNDLGFTLGYSPLGKAGLYITVEHGGDGLKMASG